MVLDGSRKYDAISNQNREYIRKWDNLKIKAASLFFDNILNVDFIVASSRIGSVDKNTTKESNQFEE